MGKTTRTRQKRTDRGDGGVRVAQVQKPHVARWCEPETTLRDLDRIREKVHLSVEPAHLLFLLAAVFVAFGLAFAVGLIFGKHQRPDEARSPSELVASSEPAPRLVSEPAPRLVSEPAPRLVLEPVPRLVESDSRPATRQAASGIVLPVPVWTPAPRGAEASPVAVRRAQVFLPPGSRGPDLAVLREARRGAVDLPGGPADLDLETTGPGRKPVEVELWPSLAVSGGDGCVSCALPDGCTLPVVQAPKARPVAQDEKVHGGKAQRASEKSQEAKAVRDATGVKHRFAVQVSAQRDEALAREIVAHLMARGHDAYVERFEDGAGTVWFRVRIGRFADAARAREFAARFNSTEGAQAIPVEVR